VLVGAADKDTFLSGCRIEGGSVVATLTVDCLLAGNPGLCLLAAGGLAGGVFEGRVEDCHSTADVTVTGFTGGQQDSVPGWAGGLVGIVQGSVINSCSAGGSVTVDVGTAIAGGLVGGLFAEIGFSYATGDVVSTKVAGGLAGTGGGVGGATSSYATGNVTGGISAAGIVAEDGGALACYSRADIFSPNNVGGICSGVNTAAIFSYSASTYSQGGGLRIYPVAAVGDNSYWDSTVSLLGFSDPAGRTTTQMTFPYELATTYQAPEWQPSAGYWLFDDASGLNNGYPYHPWQTARVSAVYKAGAGGTVRVDGGASSASVTVTRIPGATSGSIEAVPRSGSAFVRWSDGSTANPRVDRNLTGGLSVSAVFDVPPVSEVVTYLLGISTTGFPDRNGDGRVDAGDLLN
jgi:hypothetical protein